MTSIFFNILLRKMSFLTTEFSGQAVFTGFTGFLQGKNLIFMALP
jgi:hypothetical protein